MWDGYMLNLVIGNSGISQSTESGLLGHVGIVRIGFVGLEEFGHSVADDEDASCHGLLFIR